MLKFASISAFAAFALAACANPEAEFEGDFIANGMDPAAWTAKVLQADKTMTISVTGARDVVGGLPVRSTAEGAVLLTSKTSEGDFVMKLSQTACKDGMSERTYNWSVEVAWMGELLKGCLGAD